MCMEEAEIHKEVILVKQIIYKNLLFIIILQYWAQTG